MPRHFDYNQAKRDVGIVDFLKVPDQGALVGIFAGFDQPRMSRAGNFNGKTIEARQYVPIYIRMEDGSEGMLSGTATLMKEFDEVRPGNGDKISISKVKVPATNQDTGENYERTGYGIKVLEQGASPVEMAPVSNPEEDGFDISDIPF